jgi:PTS system nitrogen regulatory IIA component
MEWRARPSDTGHAGPRERRGNAVPLKQGRNDEGSEGSGSGVRAATKLSSILDEKLILCGMKARDKREAISELASLIVQTRPDLTEQAIIGSVLARERECTTAIGRRCAFPHGKIAGLDRMIVALGISEHGIDCDALDGIPVNFMVLILTGEVASLEYLATLAAFASLSREPEKLRVILDATCPREMMQAIDGFDINLSC